MTTRTLAIVRHAKAEASAPTDYERQLTDDGHAAASRTGVWLASVPVTPDGALVSAATRTQQTWEDVALAAGWDLELAEPSEALYAVGVDGALDLVKATDDVVTTLVVVGHNPTVSQLAQLLDDGEGDVAAGNDLALGFATSAAAVFRYEGAWAELDEASATLAAFHDGRG